ncbi:hypothetical protein L2E82_17087 [Cichorium intybus]|uniref:Uncharacterized protein n=1 Tax=Cichorium intybus TaxID=13427 RepID=A0ACB9F8K7_CICIN|nr:hypothetical protein L2E82_17087 [Cichorium intybus]
MAGDFNPLAGDSFSGRLAAGFPITDHHRSTFYQGLLLRLKLSISKDYSKDYRPVSDCNIMVSSPPEYTTVTCNFGAQWNRLDPIQGFELLLRVSTSFSGSRLD